MGGALSIGAEAAAPRRGHARRGELLAGRRRRRRGRRRWRRRTPGPPSSPPPSGASRSSWRASARRAPRARARPADRLARRGAARASRSSAVVPEGERRRWNVFENSSRVLSLRRAYVEQRGRSRPRPPASVAQIATQRRCVRGRLFSRRSAAATGLRGPHRRAAAAAGAVDVTQRWYVGAEAAVVAASGAQQAMAVEKRGCNGDQGCSWLAGCDGIDKVAPQVHVLFGGLGIGHGLFGDILPATPSGEERKKH